MKITDELDARISLIARQRRTTRSEVVRAALALVEIEREKPLAMSDLIGHLAGCVVGPEELSSDPRHMEGFGA